MTEQRILRIKRQLQQSRMRLSKRNREFAAPLYDMLFVAAKEVERISTNGVCIYFDPDWLQRLGNPELDFILSHQLMHILLKHIERPKYYTGDRFHLACDIIANSHLESLGWQENRLPHIGKIFTNTFFPSINGNLLTPEEAFNYVPFDPAALKKGVRRNYMIDSEFGWDLKDDRGECGIIVLSPDDIDPEIQDGDNEESHCRLYIIEGPLPEKLACSSNVIDISKNGSPIQKANYNDSVNFEIIQLRQMKAADEKACQSTESMERMWHRTNAATLDWRKLLNSFIQEDICDYSFTPPDKRLQDTEFFLPDYNVTTESINNILFMVDTSASINNDALSAVYNEIYSALSMLNGGISGVIGFFDTYVHTPVQINSTADLMSITPIGNGATDFSCIFDYVNKKMGTPPACIVIFTDGKSTFPDETVANNIPVLWLLSDRGSYAPWGRTAYVTN